MLKVDPEFQSFIPALSADERAELEASLLAEGCRDALVVWAGQGVIVDGHNRYALCQQHGIAFDVIERDFEDRDAVKEWIIRNQFARRNLTPYVRSALALRLKDVIAARAKARQLEGLKRGTELPVVANLPQRDMGKTRDALAEAAGVGSRTIDKVEAVERDAPEPVKAAARAGDISTNRAYELTRALGKMPEGDRERAAAICIDHDEKARILARLHQSQRTDPDSNGTYEDALRTGGFHYGDELEKWCDFAEAGVEEINKALKSVAKHHARLAREERRLAAPPLPDGQYNLIYADPPWQYEHVVTPTRAVENHYPTMTLEDICSLPLADLVADDAILFLWVPNSLIRQGLDVVAAWGFDYRTNFVWVKDRIGMGYFTRSRHEMLFVAIRGAWLAPEPPKRFDSVVEAPRGMHSVKPECVYEILEAMYPHAKRVELFARASREGWRAWGNEV